jgi:PhzF family phenazine biosynthesis protein
MSYNYYLLDTFTTQKYKGNPTPVCLIQSPIASSEMHLLAKEFNAPVTVFVELSKEGVFPIRYFTVTGEIDACGHGTLGAAFVLQALDKPVVFETVKGIRIKAIKENSLLYIEYPKFKALSITIPATIKKALGILEYLEHFYCPELESLFIELETEKEVTGLAPNFSELIRSTDQVKEIVVMAKSSCENYDFVLRSFCPWIGIDEDPVTGSVHSVLAHYWQNKLNKSELVAYQASERGGQVFVKALKETVLIGGNAVEVLKGKINI